MILPPLYYGMHRFQTLLRKRQQTLLSKKFSKRCRDCLRSEKRKQTKRRGEKGYRKARFHREKKSQLQAPGMMGKIRGKDGGCVSAFLFLCEWRAPTHNRDSRPKVFGSLFCTCGSHSAVDNSQLFFLLFSFHFPPSTL